MGTEFEKALSGVKAGMVAFRRGWNGKGMYIFLIGTKMSEGNGWTFTNGKNDNKQLRRFIAMKTADDEVVPWVASQTDMLADDWEVCEYEDLVPMSKRL